MKEKTFRRVVIAVAVLGIIFSGLHVAYTYQKQKHASILSYIENEA